MGNPGSNEFMKRSLCILMGLGLSIADLAADPSSQCSAQFTIVGPGSVPAPYESHGDHRFLAGTEIISDSVQTLSNGQRLVGGFAVRVYSDSHRFEGGLYEGATVTTLPGVDTARGGDALTTYTPTTTQIDVQDGVFRGGSVLIDAAPPADANFNAGDAFSMGRQVVVDMIIYDGLFEGGTVSMSSSPGTAISRGNALNLNNDYGGMVQIYGGEFLGGIQIDGPTLLKFHGNEFELQPTLINNRLPTGVDVIVSGLYLDGTPFSTTVRTNRRNVDVSDSGNMLTFQAPEPTTGALAALCFVAVLRRFPRSVHRDHLSRM